MQIADALMITVGLDPSLFAKGAKQVDSALEKTKNTAEKTGKDIEAANKKAAESLNKVASAALEMFAIFLGGRGVKEFVSDITRSDAALGRLGVTLNTSPQLISAWGAAAERMGGSAGATAGSFQSLSDKIQGLQTKGEALPMAFYQIEAMGGRQIELNKGLGQTFVDLADDLQRIAATDPAKANFLGRQLGIDPDTVNLMIKNGAKVGQVAAGLQRLAPTPAQIKSAQDMQEAWTGLQQEMTSLAREIWTDLSPSLVPLLGAIKDIIVWVHSLIQGHEHWVQAIAAVFAIWTGAKFISFLNNLFALRSALLAVGAANAGFTGGGLLGFLAANPWIAGLLAAGAVLNPSDANAGENEKARHERYSGKGGGGSGNDALRHRGSGADPNLGLGKPGNLTANQKEAYAAARESGLSETASRALVANMSGEGLAVPRNVHWDGSHYAHGIVQWDDVRSAAIKRQFGKMPQDMTVAEQTKAAIWEINNDPNYAATKRALQGNNAGNMIGQLVTNYERPGDKLKAIGERSRIYSGLGGLGGSSTPKQPPKDLASTIGTLPRFPVYPAHGPGSYGALHAAALNNIGNTSTATTSSTSNEAHIGTINVHTQANDAHGIARDMGGAINSHSFANFANYGPS